MHFKFYYFLVGLTRKKSWPNSSILVGFFSFFFFFPDMASNYSVKGLEDLRGLVSTFITNTPVLLFYKQNILWYYFNIGYKSISHYTGLQIKSCFQDFLISSCCYVSWQLSCVRAENKTTLNFWWTVQEHLFGLWINRLSLVLWRCAVQEKTKLSLWKNAEKHWYFKIVQNISKWGTVHSNL